MVASVWELAGYPAETSGFYAGWAPNPDSSLLGLTQVAYADLFGLEPDFTAVHAGLECGAIGAIYPGMDMISIGPTINDVHSTRERLHIPSVDRAMRLLYAVLQRVPEFPQDR